MKYFALMALAALPLSACIADETPGAADPTDTCGRTGYSSLVGSNIAAVSLPADKTIRVLEEGQPATMDYLEQRLNIETDEDGIILRLYCG
ncbi:I78 family peptidase inhibitor [Salipiger bermudensis]|uniref:I78 family peptidase inhibitor n=1 Tax=Salipiger bermudensis TaxID=344736 RepID=UPI001CD412EF|nr:I78 family peptidase inhibitor [Salipiger bermudensis]MCA0961678.1 hypothetical protein [Salipiger bermudensis]